MRKYLLLAALSIISQFSIVSAQTLFIAPDTVCVNQRISLNSLNDSASNYYWGFCSGSLGDAPTGTNMGNGFGFHLPSNIDIVQDLDGQYYGFVVNAETDDFERLNFGSSLNNIPTVTDFGNLTHGLPHHPTSLFIYYTQGRWFVFVSGGFTESESTLGRIDFYGSLSNPAPNVANFGNVGNFLNGPKGIFIAQDFITGLYFGYVVNRNTSELIQLSFEGDVQTTPTAMDAGNPEGALNQPADMAGIYDNNQWYLFAVNRGNNTVARITLGDSLGPSVNAAEVSNIVDTNLGNFNFRIDVPSSISLTRDCGSIYAYITDSSTSQLIELEMPAAVGPYTGIDYSVVGGMNYPSCISSILRSVDNLYAFVTNTADSTLTKLMITQCTNSSIPSFSDVTPPVYYYNDTGWYNIYYVINQGLPTMQVECKQIRVQPNPNLIMVAPPTICRGDTVQLYAISNYADTFIWSPVYNLDTAYNYTDTITAWPAYNTTYQLEIKYPDGCIVDTSIAVTVVQVIADAGPDRTIADGATTTLGGPDMSLGSGYSYLWTPSQFINTNQTTSPFPSANPPYDFTYYLTVTYNYLSDSSSFGLVCQAMDTVVVTVNCGDIYAPNAFIPSSANPANNTFGILNREISQLNYFRIYDRWGVLVFSTTDITQTWDGTFNGTDEPVGVYVWIADGFCTSGREVKKRGNVSLLR